MMKFIDSKILLLIAILFSFQNVGFSQEAVDSLAVQRGEQIYKANCTSCHMMTDKVLIGPGLQGVTDRRNKEWLKKWINSSSDFIASGDADAIALYEEYNKVAMPSYYFEDADFEALFAYLKNPPIVEEVHWISSQLFILDPALWSAVRSIYCFSCFVSVATLIVVLKFTYDAMLGVGVYTSYMPEQPIAFSHKVHAGENGVDCNYCHSSARKSKHSGIPSANVCMNCHTYINEGKITGTAEISKIYDAVGFDPDSRTYIEGYEQKPIKWVRIHNLPDLSYFNHSQHVVAGKVECQTCHGPVEEMEVLYQHASLTMGWCIDCHRETEVAMEGNEYYTELHDQLKEKYKGEKITVDKIGGIECAKCHY